MNLNERSGKKELLDSDDIPFADIKKNMQELNFINTWLGGHRISIEGLKRLAGKSTELTVCEIGCGGGDNLVALNKWCRQNKISAKFIGIDNKEECIKVSKDRVELIGQSHWIASDYRHVAFEQKPDIIFSSLFCHHFSDEQLIMQLQWMQLYSKIGFFINDLERNSIAYFLIKWLTRLFSSSYLVKNDAPLSVARAFTQQDWKRLLTSAKIPEPFKIYWKWAFRYLVICKNA